MNLGRIRVEAAGGAEGHTVQKKSLATKVTKNTKNTKKKTL